MAMMQREERRSRGGGGRHGFCLGARRRASTRQVMRGTLANHLGLRVALLLGR